MMDFADLGALQLAQMIANGEISSLEVIEACIARIDNREEDIGAWAHLDYDYARKQAEFCDTYRASGAPCGPLHGIPVGIKDIFNTEDFPTEYGSVVCAGRQSTANCTVVNLLKSAGAVIMGKTVTAEFAYLSPGKTKNPHNLENTPGGSSSGSAAAVASGMVPLAIGSQTNGSVIRPASYCGVVGFKPSHGRISRSGALILSRVLDHVGVFARSVEDAALITDNLIVYDPSDPDTQLSPTPRLLEISQKEPPAEPRFAFVETPFWDQAANSTQEAFEELSNILGESCDLVALPEEFNAVAQNLKTIMSVDMARNLAGFLTKGENNLSEQLRAQIREGTEVSAIDYNDSVDQIQPLRTWIHSLCDEYDAILTPAACGEAPKGLEATGNPIFCTTWTYLGLPAINLPLMEGENGLPLGVQVVGPKNDDARLLRTARSLINKIFNA